MDIIDPRNLLIKLSAILDKLGLDYYVTGGMAVSVWGRPRATFDIDIVINLVEPQIEELSIALKKISEYGYIDEEASREAIRTHGEFNFIDPESGVKIDFWVASINPTTKREFKRRKSIKIDRRNVYFISPEDLIVSKLIWYKKTLSSRHIEDIESVLKISGKKLDMRYLKGRANQIDTDNILRKMMRERQ